MHGPAQLVWWLTKLAKCFAVVYLSAHIYFGTLIPVRTTTYCAQLVVDQISQMSRSYLFRDHRSSCYGSSWIIPVRIHYSYYCGHKVHGSWQSRFLLHQYHHSKDCLYYNTYASMISLPIGLTTVGVLLLFQTHDIVAAQGNETKCDTFSSTSPLECWIGTGLAGSGMGVSVSCCSRW